MYFFYSLTLEKRETCKVIIASESQWNLNVGMLTASLVGLKELILNRLNEVLLPELKENKQDSLVVDEKEDVDDDDEEDEEKSSKKCLSEIFVYICMLMRCACVLKHDRSLRMMKNINNHVEIIQKNVLSELSLTWNK